MKNVVALLQNEEEDYSSRLCKSDGSSATLYATDCSMPDCVHPWSNDDKNFEEDDLWWNTTFTGTIQKTWTGSVPSNIISAYYANLRTFIEDKIIQRKGLSEGSHFKLQKFLKG